MQFYLLQSWWLCKFIPRVLHPSGAKYYNLESQCFPTLVDQGSHFLGKFAESCANWSQFFCPRCLGFSFLGLRCLENRGGYEYWSLFSLLSKSLRFYHTFLQVVFWERWRFKALQIWTIAIVVRLKNVSLHLFSKPIWVGGLSPRKRGSKPRTKLPEVRCMFKLPRPTENPVSSMSWFLRENTEPWRIDQVMVSAWEYWTLKDRSQKLSDFHVAALRLHELNIYVFHHTEAVHEQDRELRLQLAA